MLYAQLWPGGSTDAVLAALHAVCTSHGLPLALYIDRAGWAFYTPQAGGPTDRTRPTQVGRALERLGIEHIDTCTPPRSAGGASGSIARSKAA